MRRPAAPTVALALACVLLLGACSRSVEPGEDTTPPGEVVESPVATPTGAPTSEPSTASPTTASPSPAGSIDDVQLRVEEVVTGLGAAVLLTSPPDDPRRFVVEQAGRVRLLQDGELSTYLDLTDRVTAGGERGLLGLAFHPEFASNGRLFVHYSGEGGDTVLAEYSADPGAGTADAASERVLLTVEQPASNHNGGTVAFGPDGMLWLGLGDGGAAGDRFGNGQDPGTLLGTLLRVDVDGEHPYAIPPDNPFADGEGGAPEVWGYGLRNPWRFTFHDGQVLIGDVGQDAVEELDAAAVSEVGANFGWPVLEGPRCFQQEDCAPPEAYVPPAASYTHEETGGCSVIAGEVYDGTAAPALRGHWFYTDLCAGFLRSIRVEHGEVVEERDWTEQVGRLDGPLSFGRDAAGELYVTTQDGRLLRLVAEQ